MTQDQIERYEFQQTEAGQKMLQMSEWMKNQYCTKLGVPVSRIKTGKLIPLVNGNTGEIDSFIEK